MSASGDIVSDGFGKSLERFRQRLSDNEKLAFASGSIEEVKRELQRIQDRLGPEKKLRGLARIRKFLEGMKQVEALVSIFLNVHEVVAFIWGPVKLALMMASTKIETLDMLLGTYQDIADVLDGIKKYDKLFKNYPDFRKILEDYFYDILEFHHAVLVAFGKPRDWKRFVGYVWPTFKSKFGPILDSLKRHRALLADEKVTVLLEEVQEFRTVMESRIQDILQEVKTKHGEANKDKSKDIEHREMLQKRKSTIVIKLGSPNYQGDHSLAFKQRQIDSAGDWVLEDPRFKTWAYGDSSGVDPILYLNGIPGSGKTTLVSRMVEHLQTEKLTVDARVLFFYFGHTHKDEVQKTKSVMLRAFLHQLVHQDDGLLDYMHQELASVTDSTILDEQRLGRLVKHCLGGQQMVWVVLDGLDDCDETREMDKMQSRHVIRWFQEEVLLPMNPPQARNIRLLISGQRDGHIDQMLRKHPWINLDTTKAHIGDIENFVKSRSARIRDRFSLDTKEETEIARKVISLSRGMFLYAKIVLDNLFSQDSLDELDRELSEDHFPREINEAYERVAVRIFDRSSPSRKKSATSILSWIVTAGRPLHWREIQSRFCIDPEKEICNARVKRVDSCKVICGSLVEVESCDIYPDVESEQTVAMVHHTAAKYLCLAGRISPLNIHAEAAIFYSKYLTSKPFTPGFPSDTIQDLALAGYYGLHDYAAVYWHHHVKAVLDSEEEISAKSRKEVVQSTGHLFAALCRHLPQQYLSLLPDGNTPRDLTDMTMLSMIEEYNRTDPKASRLAEATLVIRQAIEAIDASALEDTKRKAFEQLNGVLRFKCPSIRCVQFATGFSNSKKRWSHIQEHERPFKCTTDGCYARITGFSSKRALDAHIKRLHEIATNPSSIFPQVGGKKPPTIHAAAAQGDLDAVKAFHRMGVPLDEPSQHKGSITPLLLAARHRHVHVCEYLVQNGADPCYSSHGYLAPIIEAIAWQDTDLYLMFRAHCKTPVFHSRIPLCMAYAVAKSGEILDHIMNTKPAQYTGANTFQDVLGHLVKACSQTGYTRLLPATDSELQTQIKRLHKTCRSFFPALYKPDGTSFRKIPDTDEIAVEQRKLLHGTFLGGNSWKTYLHKACHTQSFTAGYFLMNMTAPGQLSVPDGDGRRPLHRLSFSSQVKSDFVKSNALIFAREVIMYDTSAVNLAESDGDFPLHSSARRYGNRQLFPVILEYTADLEHRNKKGETALDLCVFDQSKECLQSLLQTNRVSVSTLNKALDNAIKRQEPNEEIIRMLREALDAKEVDSKEPKVGTYDLEMKKVDSEETAVSGEVSESEYLDFYNSVMVDEGGDEVA